MTAEENSVAQIAHLLKEGAMPRSACSGALVLPGDEDALRNLARMSQLLHEHHLSRLALGGIRVGAAVAEEFPGRIHHRAAAGLPGRWGANQSNEVAFSGYRN